MLSSLLFAAVLSASPLTLDDVLARVREANPDLAEADARAAAEVSRARKSGRLPEPMLQAQAWNAPADAPWAEPEMYMYGVQQSLPLALLLERRESRARADSAKASPLVTWSAIRRDAVVAFWEYWRTGRELDAHKAHLELSNQIRVQVRSRYTSGVGRQHDVLRADVSVAQLHAAIHGAEQDHARAREALAQLMSLEPGAEPGAPSVPDPDPPLPDLAALRASLPKSRPDVRVAEADARAADAARRTASAERWLPELMVGLTWMDARMMDPMTGEPDEDGWMPMVGLSLPFFSGARRDEARATRAESAAARSARDSVLRGAHAELAEAWSRAESSARITELYRTDIVPAAERSVEATRAAYVTGTATVLDLLDATQTLLDARIAADASRAHYHAALADLARAAGIPEKN